MSLVPFKELMAEAERGQYAVGYFESWNLESLQAVADAAEATHSPVILGFSGADLSNPMRMVKEHLSLYAAMGIAACRRLSVPACLLLNESPRLDWALEAINLGFGLVMFTDENLSFDEQLSRICQVVKKAHQVSAAVEGELTPLPGVYGGLSTNPPPLVGGGRGGADDLHLTDAIQARTFVERTGVDTLAVNVGQVHLHGRSKVSLNLSRLVELKEAIPVPLVLHGASSVHRADLKEAAKLGIRKINVGSVLKQSYFEAMRRACMKIGDDYNPYDVVGSGLENDVLAAGRMALQKVVEDLMRLFGSADKA
ncbi:class II fructose-bisphosphate aldolase [Candidatus Poribacteria bacterium]|nr:class II fructose-bisphosphate aldolase [Candidatus Poribacteria bacterium]